MCPALIRVMIAEKAGIISRNPQIVSAVFQDVVDVGSGSDIGDE